MKKRWTLEEKIYREQHGDTASSYNNLGTVYGALNQYVAAKRVLPEGAEHL